MPFDIKHTLGVLGLGECKHEKHWVQMNLQANSKQTAQAQTVKGVDWVQNQLGPRLAAEP